MRQNSKSCFKMLALLALLSTLNFQPSTLFAQGTSFTYQGQLQNNGSPTSGTYNMQFSLWNAAVNGIQQGTTLATNGVVVTNGLFTLVLDFGSSMWNGSTNWLQIAVETNLTGMFTLLSPRQEVMPTPYAIFAESASNVVGVVPASGLSGTYSAAVSLNNAGNSFTGNGLGLTGVNAATLDGLGAANFWQLTGNSGTTAGANYVGTADYQPLELHVYGSRTLRLEPDASGVGAPNVIGGSQSNYVSDGVVGATIAGGGATNWSGLFGYAIPNIVLADYGSVGGGEQNTASGQWATVAGGADNTGSGADATVSGGIGNQAVASGATVGGGQENTVSGLVATIAGGGVNNASGANASIGGGSYNTAIGTNATVSGGQGNSAGGAGAFIGGGGFDGGSYSGNTNLGSAATLGGGLGNFITSAATYGFVGGGQYNSNNSYLSTISGGGNNSIAGDTGVSTIGGGEYNSIAASDCIIGGGTINSIAANAYQSTIGGGNINSIGSSADQSTIAGGDENVIGASANGATIGGGRMNTNTAAFATVPGGNFNWAGGNYSFAAGYGAQATNFGSFVWADPSQAAFGSVSNNTFSVRAVGGIRLFTSASTGEYLASGSGMWSSVSDRNAKEDLAPLDPTSVLAKVAALPLSSWSYKTQKGVRHAGPMAQDFRVAFGLGEDDKHIGDLDESGVALAAIQGLDQKLEQKERTILDQSSQIRNQAEQIADLNARLQQIERLVTLKDESLQPTEHPVTSSKQSF